MAISKFSIKSRKGDPIVSEENALPHLLDACHHFDIDIDAETDKKKRKNMEAMLSSILDFMMRGFIEINTSTWVITQHIKEDYGEKVDMKTIDYKPATAETKLALDGIDENDRYEMVYAALGACSGLGDIVIKKLTGIDLKVAESLMLFLS